MFKALISVILFLPSVLSRRWRERLAERQKRWRAYGCLYTRAQSLALELSRRHDVTARTRSLLQAMLWEAQRFPQMCLQSKPGRDRRVRQAKIMLRCRIGHTLRSYSDDRQEYACAVEQIIIVSAIHVLVQSAAKEAGQGDPSLPFSKLHLRLAWRLLLRRDFRAAIAAARLASAILRGDVVFGGARKR